MQSEIHRASKTSRRARVASSWVPNSRRNTVIIRRRISQTPLQQTRNFSVIWE